jgi:UDP-glucose:(heptosyl)LPS alpha-1,3-glucosyltransferase
MTTLTRPLCIAFLIDRWEPERGGAERAMAALATHLLGRGHRVLAFARRASPDAPGEFHAVPTGGWSRKSRERALARALSAAAAEAGADVTIGMRHLEQVDVFWPHAGAHARGLEAREAAKRRDPKSDADADEAEPTGRHALFCELEASLCAAGGARRIVCVSQLVADELHELYPACAPRTVVVPNGVDLEHFHPRARELQGRELRERLGLKAGDKLVAFLAHDAALKGLPTLLDALVALRRDDVHLVMAGPRPLARWQRRAERALGQARVHAFESLDALELLSAADVLAHPTWRDTSGRVLLEALAVGTPVITTSRAGEAGLVREGVSGSVLEDPGNPQALAVALAEWLNRGCDRGELHASVSARAQKPWLEALEAIVVESAKAASAG